MREIQLGLGKPPVRRFLFIQQDERDPSMCWHELDFSTTPPKQIAVPESAITGYFTGLRLKEVASERHGSKWKLDIYMDAGEPFALRSGADTTFSRNVLLALATIDDPLQLAEPFTIAVSPGEKKNVFAAVYFAKTGQRIKAEWDKTAELVPIVSHLQTIFGDGGQGDEVNEEGYGSPAPDSTPNYRDSQPRSEVTARAGLATADQIRELTRVGRLQGLVDGDDCSKLNDDCARLHKGRMMIDLTTGEVIEYRKTLLSM